MRSYLWRSLVSTMWGRNTMSSRRRAPAAIDSDAAVDAAVAQAVAGATVFILRGVSGSGKSRLAAALRDALPSGMVRIVSADDYFIARGGRYAFDPARLGDAHAYCRRAFDAALRARQPVIVVDNTNTQWWEYAPYAAAVTSFNDAVRAGRVSGVAWPPTFGSGAHMSGPAERGGEGGWSAAGFLSSEAHARGVQPGAPRPRPRVAEPTHDGDGAPAQTTYALRIVEFACPDEETASRFAGRNAHGVPSDAVLRMWARLRDDPDPDAAIVVRQAPAAAPSGPRVPTQSSAAFARGAGAGSASRPAAFAPGRDRAPPHRDVLQLLASRVVYVGLFLSQRSREAVLKAHPPVHSLAFCDHVTVMHQPPRGRVTPALLRLVGAAARLAVGPACADDDAQAAVARWCDGSDARDSGGDGDERGGDARDRGGDGDATSGSGSDGDATGGDGSGAGDAEGDGSHLRALLAEALTNGLSSNAQPHVTISTRSGVPPSASNALLARAARRPPREPRRAVVVRAIFGLALTQGSPALPRVHILSQVELQQYLEQLGST